MNKGKFRIALLAVGVLLIFNAFAAGIIASFHIGVIAEFLIGAAFALYGVLWYELTRVKWLNVVMLTTLFMLIVSVAFLYAYGHSSDASEDEEAAIILGAGLRGETVSAPLARRLIKTVQYYEINPTALLCVTGGQGRGEFITEAEAEFRWLTDRGISDEYIIKEDKSTSTRENLLFAKQLLDERLTGDYTAVIVTNAFHAFRARLIADGLGLNTHRLSAGDGYVLALPSYLRELAAITAMLMGL